MTVEVEGSQIHAACRKEGQDLLFVTAPADRSVLRLRARAKVREREREREPGRGGGREREREREREELFEKLKRFVKEVIL